MSIKNSARYDELKDALQVLNELKIPDALHEVALKHLLSGHEASPIAAPGSGRSLVPIPLPSGGPAGTKELRNFIGGLKPKGAVAEIPCLLYWAKTHEEKDEIDEKGIVELYRRAGLRPPKNVAQSLRDLASRKYDRLEAVAGQPGYVRLSRVGEDFVLHDLSGAN